MRSIFLIVLLTAGMLSLAQAHSVRQTGRDVGHGADQDSAQKHHRNAKSFGTAIDRMIQGCQQEAADLKNMHLSLISQTVQLDDQQRSALQDLQRAADVAAKSLDDKCFKKTQAKLSDKIDELGTALQLMADAFRSLRPSVAGLYAALDDEQKAQLAVLSVSSSTATQSKRRSARKGRGSTASPDAEHDSSKSMCLQWAADLRTWPVSQIESEMPLSDQQRAALYELTAAIYRSAGDLVEACPVESSLTPLGRLDANEDTLRALKQDTEAIRPYAAVFEGALDDAQMKQLFAEIGEP